MALMGFGDIEDVFGRVDRMMNGMMGGMFSDPMMMDPFGMHSNMMPMSMSPYMGHRGGYNPYNPSSVQSFSMSASPGSSGYYSSSMTTMSTGLDGRRQVYQQSNSEHYAPDGVRETRRSVRDSQSGLQAMSVGHHIRDRGHVMQQSRNAYTGEREENEEYINLEEDEGVTFENEFNQRLSSQRRPRHTAIDGHHRRHHRSEQLALPAPVVASQEPVVEFPPDSPPPQASTSRCPSRGSSSGKEKRSKKREKKPYKK